ncbi:hypothetical protein ZOSMA_11G00680 [Zostera marina]|uniref:Early nodulin-93 n=1 Tax=Zostera marina TaxID=29655 RepID=A0A0K9Q3K8_ZOSMR|nr:hypothetical protein ZOSMA_11G00680 [Zostera marina]
MGGREILYLFNLHHPSSSNLIFDLPELKKMGIPTELRDAWVSRRQSSAGCVPVASAHENRSTVKEAVIAGSKSAAIAGVVSAVPVLVGCRIIPWAKANLNYVAQTLLISSACVTGFFISADKKILENAHRNSLAKFDKSP